MAVLLLGSTDFTLAVAAALEESGIRVGAIAHVGKRFEISYSKDGVPNLRTVDIPAWCADHDAKTINYSSIPALTRDIEGETYDACILAGWYHMVPASFRTRFERGCLGFHASLLPKLRGGAPLGWSILSELGETGLSLFEVGDGVDDGALFDQERFPIGPRTCVADLIRATEEAMVTIVKRSMPSLLSGELQSSPQVGEPSYCIQRAPEDGRINWRQPAAAIDRLIRASGNPYTGGLTELDGREISMQRTELVCGIRGEPGTISAGPVVACGSGALAIVEAVFENRDDAMAALVPGKQFS